MNDRWRKLHANMHQYAPLRTSMRQHCSLSAVQRKTALEQSWWAWNAMVFVPMAKAPPKGGAKLLYNLDLIPEFTSLFSTKVIYAGLPAKAFPRNQAFVDISVFLWLQKQRPSFAQGQPKGYFQLKELHRTTKADSQMNADWKVDKAQYAEFNLPTCGKIAVWQLCRERQPWWNSHDGPELRMLGSMPWCSLPWQKLLPRLAQNCCTVQNWFMSFHPRFRGMWFMQVCLGKHSHESRPL